jgi:muramidase (phage lysozyme)
MELNNNRKSFLSAIAVSEGTANIGDQQGYNVLVGGTTFYGYMDHPRKLFYLPRLGIKSTAAGRYQILARYYDAYKKQLGLKDFTPDSQDKIALQMIKECKALPLIDAGKFEEAITACKSRWASLPGAGYNQHEHTMDFLKTAYLEAGGKLEYA